MAMEGGGSPQEPGGWGGMRPSSRLWIPNKEELSAAPHARRHARTHAQTHMLMHGSDMRRQQARGGRKKCESTSILRPSTIVPLSFSRARSASVLVSKVTKPKP